MSTLSDYIFTQQLELLLTGTRAWCVVLPGQGSTRRQSNLNRVGISTLSMPTLVPYNSQDA